GIIEGSKEAPWTNLSVTLENLGEATFFSSDAIVVDIPIAPDSVEGWRIGDATKHDFGHLHQDKFELAHRREATCLRFQMPGLRHGEKLQIGPIHLTRKPDQESQIECSIRLS